MVVVKATGVVLDVVASTADSRLAYKHAILVDT